MRLRRNSWTALVKSACVVSALAACGAARAASVFTVYNVVVIGTHTDSSAVVQGTTFDNNLVAVNTPEFAQSTAAGTGDVLTVAGVVTGSAVTLDRGVYRYHQASAPAANLNGGATLAQDSTVTMTGLSNQISAASSYYASLTGTTPALSGSSLALTASGAGATVFNEPASNLSAQNENVTLTAAAGQSIVVVVPDVSFSFGSSEHISLGGSTTAAQVMWVFPNATSLTLNDSQWQGSILAPLATLVDNSQVIFGGVYVKNFVQTAAVSLASSTLTAGQPQFTGPISATPEPATLLPIFMGVCAMRRRTLKG